ncbi:MAG: hypothetical protein HY820_26485 [Acidobacteria bacterium]|nr:hypothetical protein [Acidobacteriota bacterium]
MRTFDHPIPGRGLEAYASGRVAGTHKRCLLRWSGGRLQSIYSSSSNRVLGWRGANGTEWILDGNKIHYTSGAGLEKAERRGAFPATIYGVTPQPDGGFWLSTIDGVVQHVPGVWQTPAGARDIDVTIHSITQLPSGTMWFAAGEELISLDGEQWKRYTLPGGYRTDVLQSDCLCPLNDGRLAVKGFVDDENRILLLDPVSGRFTEKTYPGGRTIRFLACRKDGTTWVRTAPVSSWTRSTERTSSSATGSMVNGTAPI